jgi:hypothetical protein
MREKINRQHHPDLSSNNIDSRQNYCRTDSHDRINQGTLCTQRPWSEHRLKVKTWSNKKNRILPALARRRAKNTTGGKTTNPRTRELETERKSREGHEAGGGARQRASGDPQGRKPGRRLLRGRTPTAQGEKIATQRLGCGTKQKSCET